MKQLRLKVHPKANSDKLLSKDKLQYILELIKNSIYTAAILQERALYRTLFLIRKHSQSQGEIWLGNVVFYCNNENLSFKKKCAKHNYPKTKWPNI